MKKFIITSLFFLPLLASAQADFNPIVDNLRKGTADGLVAYMDTKIELTLPGQDGLFSKADAAAAIGRFLTANHPTACEIVHKGTSDGKDSQYAISTLTAGGKTYRVYIYLKQVPGKFLIRDMRFEKE